MDGKPVTLNEKTLSEMLKNLFKVLKEQRAYYMENPEAYCDSCRYFHSMLIRISDKCPVYFKSSL